MFFSNKRSYTKFGGKWLKDIKNERLKINQLYWTDGDTTFVSFEDLDRHSITQKIQRAPNFARA